MDVKLLRQQCETYLNGSDWPIDNDVPRVLLRILDAFEAMATVGFSLCATDVYSPDTDVLDIAAEVATPERTSWSASGIDGVDEQHPLAALLAAADTLNPKGT